MLASNISQPLISQNENFEASEIDDFIFKMKQGLSPYMELHGHSDMIRCVKVSGNLIATGSKDLTVRVYDLNSRTEKFLLKGHQRWIFSVGFSKDGKKLFSGSGDGVLKVWDMETGTELHSMQAHKGTLSCISATDSFIITGSFDNSLKSFEISSLKEVNVYSAHEEPVYCMITNSLGTEIYSGSRDKTIKIWHINNIKPIYTLEGHTNWVYSLAITSDDSFLVSASEDRTVRVWNLVELQQKFILPGYSMTVTSVAITTNNNYIFSGSDSIMKVWDFNTHNEVFTLACHKDYIRSMAPTPDGNFMVSVGDDHIVKIWNISYKKPKSSFIGHENIVSCLAINYPILASSSDDKTVKFWELSKNELIWSFAGHTDRVFGVCLSPDNSRAFSCSADCTLRVLNINMRSEEAIIKGHTRWIRCIVCCKYGLFTGSDDNFVYFASLEKLEIKSFSPAHEKPVYSLALDPTNNFLASGSSDNKIKIWKTESRFCISTLSGHKDAVNALLFITCTKLVSASSDKSIKIWNLDCNKEEFTLYGHTGFINDLSFLNNLVISVSGDSTIRAWNLEERRQEYMINCKDSHLNSVVSFSDHILTGSSDKLIHLFSLRSADTVLLEPLDHQSFIDFIAATGALESFITELSSLQISMCFTKYNFTLAHIFAHLGDDEKLKKCLELGLEIRRDAICRSPLFYAIKKNSQPCIDLLLMYIIGLSSDLKKFAQASYAIRDDFIALISNSSALLPDLMDNLLLFEFKKFGSPLGKLPMTQLTTIQKVYFEEFLSPKDQNSQEFLLEFKTSAFKLPIIEGSKSSLELLETLQNCNNKQIFKSPLIKLFIKSRWEKMWYALFAYTLILWINLLIILLLIVYCKENLLLIFLLIIINIFLFSMEIVQMINSGFVKHFSSIWNFVDLLRLILTMLWIILSFCDIVVILLMWLVVLINGVKGIIGFRCFDRTRYYVRLIFRAFNDIFSFMIIFFYTTLLCGLLFSSIKYNENDINASYYLWLSPFDMNLGNFEAHKNMEFEYISFILSAIINAIVLLSLLISILGDSFDKFQLESMEINYMEMAEFVYELELIFFWNADRNIYGYLQTSEQIENSIKWEGSIKTINENFQKILDKKIGSLQNDLSLISENFTTQLKHVIAKMSAIESKLSNLHSNSPRKTDSYY